MTVRRTSRIARTALALLVLAAFVLPIAPIASVSAGNLCTLACCAGRAPHAAGSCMDGTCHVAIRNRKKAVHKEHPQRSEELCGIKSIVGKHHSTSPPLASNGSSDLPGAEAATLSKPCLPECASCSGFAPSNSLRKSAVLARVDRPTPPSLWQTRTDADVVVLSETLGCRHSPRGPPA